MTRPPFKINGRGARLRYVNADGRKVARGGRISFLWVEYLTGVIAGTIGEAEIALYGGPWHRISATPTEAITVLSQHFTTRGHVRRGEICRAARVERGKPVLP